MGAPSKGELTVRFLDQVTLPELMSFVGCGNPFISPQFENICIPDEIFLNNIVLSHDCLIVKHQPFKTSKDTVVIAAVYCEPKTLPGGKFVHFNPSDIV